MPFCMEYEARFLINFPDEPLNPKFHMLTFEVPFRQCSGYVFSSGPLLASSIRHRGNKTNIHSTTELPT